MEEASKKNGFPPVARIEVMRAVKVTLGEKPRVLPRK